MLSRRLLFVLLIAGAFALLGRDTLTDAVDAVRDAAEGLPGAGGAAPAGGRVTHVRDGDTFEARIRGEQQVVRLLAIDTPESVRPGTPIECGALEAKDLLLRMLFTRPRDTDGDGLVDRDGGRGRRVVLERDPTQDDADRYGRVIRYARVRGAERTVQERVLAAGWAAVYVFRQRRFERFDAFVSAARQGQARPPRCVPKLPRRLPSSGAAMSADATSQRTVKQTLQLFARSADEAPMPAPHLPVMERLSIPALASSPDRELLDAIRAWLTDSKGMSLLEYTGLRRTEFAALCRDETPVDELLRRRVAQPLAA